MKLSEKYGKLILEHIDNKSALNLKSLLLEKEYNLYVLEIATFILKCRVEQLESGDDL